MARYFQRDCCGRRGEGLKANRSIAPGQLLYSASPYTYIPSKKAMGSVCEHCLSRFQQYADELEPRRLFASEAD
ncbi:hypothetical protein chiPu_0012886 [Chiloscyllium punctatum]|uniref:Uncharacterized protein n=1 Tax=Chiloscyllium punctatum TaxID=137246 RepID=A0A401SVL1_CHIPU|nr:hypothetical protein [Chiloscyllium punctatum]